jgi:hypothetical protein
MLNSLSPAAEKRWHDSLTPLIGTYARVICLAGKNLGDQPHEQLFAIVQLTNQTRRVVSLRPLPHYQYHVGERLVLRLSKIFDTDDHRCMYQLMAYPV